MLEKSYLPLDDINVQNVFRNANLLETDLRNLWISTLYMEKDEMEKSTICGFKTQEHKREN